MAAERKIRRYAPYFQGWATAFGNHDRQFDETRELMWLFGTEQVGLILTPRVKSFLDPLLTVNGEAPLPQVVLGPGALQVADARISFRQEDRPALDAVMSLLKSAGDLHLLQTYHLVYPSGTRILTLTRQTPLGLVYREIEPLILQQPT